MSTSTSRYGGSSRVTQDKLQQAAQLAGIADVFGRGATQGEPLLTLQQSLLGGIVRSQQQEARRLARRDGSGDGKEGSPRMQQARARTAQLQALVADAVGKARLVGRVADTLGTPGVFAGYVYGESGAPAPEHEVRLHIADKANGREVTASAKTDDDGYFRMSWAAAGKGGRVQAAPDAATLAADLLAALAGDNEAAPVVEVKRATAAFTNAGASASTSAGASGNASAPANATTNPATGAGTVPPSAVRVQVADPRGALVFEDPSPPSFDTLSSEFRCYVVPVRTADGQGEPKR